MHSSRTLYRSRVLWDPIVRSLFLLRDLRPRYEIVEISEPRSNIKAHVYEYIHIYIYTPLFRETSRKYPSPNAKKSENRSSEPIEIPKANQLSRFFANDPDVPGGQMSAKTSRTVIRDRAK